MSADDLMGDFPPAPGRLAFELAQGAVQRLGFSQRPPADPDRQHCGLRRCGGLEMSLEEIGHVGFVGHDGHPTTVRQALRATRTDAFVVLRRGRIAAEWYDNGMDATTPHIVFSVSKSICGTLGGILADRGLLDPE